MKNDLFLFLPALVLAGVLATLNFGCGNKNAPTSGLRPAADPRLRRRLGGKDQFQRSHVATRSGRQFLPYLGTAQWLDGLSAKSAPGGQAFNAMPGLKPDDAAKVNKAFDIATRLIKDSGIEDVSGVGMSSVEIEKGMFRNKMLLHHYPGKGDGFLWKLAGGEPHPLNGLDFLPADTAMAFFPTRICRCSGMSRKRKSPRRISPGAAMAGQPSRPI